MDNHLDIIRQLESSGGKHDGCLSKGLINGYGYMQSTYHWKCFDNHDQVRNSVKVWFERHLSNGMSIATAICYYNTGHKVSNCPYYEKYQLLSN